MQSGARQFWGLVLVLLAGAAVINLWQAAGESRVDRRPFEQFPLEIGAWRRLGPDGRFDAATEKVLNADDYLNRDYTNEGRRVSLYIGYYSTQRTGATYHSPLNCLPGSGWELVEPSNLDVQPTNGGRAFQTNQYVVKHGSERQLLVYWYQGRGRAIANEYWDKVYTVLDSVRLRRSDGAMVRILVPITGSDQHAVDTAREFAGQIAPELSAFVPG